jgi:hypothetical protein
METEIDLPPRDTGNVTFILFPLHPVEIQNVLGYDQSIT